MNSYYEKDNDSVRLLTRDDLLFELPKGWSWTRLQSLCIYLHRGKSPKYSDEEEYPVFAQKCNQPGYVTLEKVKFADPSTFDRYGNECYLQDNDIVVNSTGTGTLGRVGLFKISLLGKWPCIVPDSHVTTVRLADKTYSAYIMYFLQSSIGQSLIFSKQTGSTNQKELPASEVSRFLVPFPPYDECVRITNIIERFATLLSRDNT